MLDEGIQAKITRIYAVCTCTCFLVCMHVCVCMHMFMFVCMSMFAHVCVCNIIHTCTLTCLCLRMLVTFTCLCLHAYWPGAAKKRINCRGGRSPPAPHNLGELTPRTPVVPASRKAKQKHLSIAPCRGGPLKNFGSPMDHPIKHIHLLSYPRSGNRGVRRGVTPPPAYGGPGGAAVPLG